MPWLSCLRNASSFTSIVSVMSTYVSGSRVTSQSAGISKGSSPSSRSSGNISRVGESGITADRASAPAAL